MDSKQYHDGDDDSELIFQDLTPEQPANIWQKSIIQMQQNWPPQWNTRHRVILLTVLSSLLIFFLLFAFIHSSIQQNDTATVTTSNSAIATMNMAQMLSYQNIIYVVKTPIDSTTGTLEALNARTGALIWSYTHHNAKIINLFSNILYIQTDTDLVALNASNRTLLWEKPMSSANYTWQIDQRILFTVTTNDIITALNASTGTQLWQTQQSSNFWQADNGIFYMTLSSGRGLRALDAHNGKLLWQNPKIIQDLTIDNGNIYLQDEVKQSLQAFDGRNGQLRWQFNIRGKDFKLSAQDGFLFLSDLEKTQVEVLDGQTGKLLWQRPGILNGLTASPNQTVISSLQTDETDVIRTADGSTLYHFTRSDALLSIEHGIAFFINFAQNASNHNSINNYVTNVEAVSLSTGTTIWSNQSREEFPLLQNNTIGIIPISGDSLLLLRDDNGHPIWQHSFDTTGN